MNSLEEFVFECKFCNKALKTRQMQAHLDLVCSETPLSCPYNEAHKVKISELRDHLKTCENSQVLCKICFQTFKFTEIESHTFSDGCAKFFDSRNYEIP